MPDLHLLRQVAATSFGLLFALVLLSENLPASHTKEELNWVDQATLIGGFEQGWGVFAPIPASLEVQTHALVSMADGEVVRWDPPGGNLLVGTARFERWRKWSTNVRTGDNRELWEDNAWRIAEQVGRDEGRQPTKVELVRRWSEAPPPGEGFEREYSEFMFYTFDPATGTGTETPTGSSDAEQEAPVEEVEAPGSESNEPGADSRDPLVEEQSEPTAPDRDVAESTTQQIDEIDQPPSRLPFTPVDESDRN